MAVVRVGGNIVMYYIEAISYYVALLMQPRINEVFFVGLTFRYSQDT